MQETSCVRISSTARLVAYFRSFTDIPYAGEIATLCKARESLTEIFEAEGVKEIENFLWLAIPMLEARFKSINYLIDHFGITSIVEIASGVSPRGLIYSAREEFYCLESDLEEILFQKMAIVESILPGGRRNLFFATINVLDRRELMEATSRLPEGKILLVHEGLLSYFNHSDKKKVVGNIYSLLKARGGVYITPDITLRARYEIFFQLSPYVIKLMEAMTGFTGRNLLENTFTDEAEAMKLFEGEGFKVEKWSQSVVTSELSSLTSENIKRERVLQVLQSSAIWAMHIS